MFQPGTRMKAVASTDRGGMNNNDERDDQNVIPFERLRQKYAEKVAGIFGVLLPPQDLLDQFAPEAPKPYVPQAGGLAIKVVTYGKRNPPSNDG